MPGVRRHRLKTELRALLREESNTMKGYEIRRARESDLDRLIELLAALQKHLEERNPRVWRESPGDRERARDRLAKRLSDPKACVIVAVSDEGAIIGLAVGSILSQERYVPDVSAYIETAFVEEPYRRGGVGYRLITELCRFFESHDVEEVSLRYIVGNSEAEQFWAKLGFEPIIVTSTAKRQDVEKRIARMGE